MLILFILASLAYGAAIFAYALDPPASEARADAQSRETRGDLAGPRGGAARGVHRRPVRRRRAPLQLGVPRHELRSAHRGGRRPGGRAHPSRGDARRDRGAGRPARAVDRGDVRAASVHDPLPAPTSALAKAHIGLATAGLGGFTIAAGIAALYLTMDRRLRLKRWKPQPGGLSLTGLERLHYHAVMLVVPVLTLTIVTGVLWTVKSGGVAAIGGRWIEVVMAAAAWLCSAAILVMRAALGVRGRKSALLTLAAFACTLLVLVWYGVRA
nr:cytochrome c biogenesis protein CcsA [Nannocystis pusilla]